MGPTDLPITKRLGAQVFTAPIGTKPGEPGWTPLGGISQVEIAPAFVKSDLTEYIYDANAFSKALAEHYLGRSPQRWTTGIEPPTERSKPLGLTKEHRYTDNDGDTLVIEENDVDDEAIAWISETSPDGFNVTAKDAISLAINVLGYDRPSVEFNAAGPTTYGDATANRAIPASKESRDANIAEAIDLLIGADIFDQRIARRKKHAEEAEAKRKADYEASKLESLNRSKAIFEQTLAAAALDGASAESAAEVQAALSAYETARRKFEGLPH